MESQFEHADVVHAWQGSTKNNNKEKTTKQ